jgi:hypothetical protein
MRYIYLFIPTKQWHKPKFDNCCYLHLSYIGCAYTKPLNDIFVGNNLHIDTNGYFILTYMKLALFSAYTVSERPMPNMCVIFNYYFVSERVTSSQPTTFQFLMCIVQIGSHSNWLICLIQDNESELAKKPTTEQKNASLEYIFFKNFDNSMRWMEELGIETIPVVSSVTDQTIS